MTAQRTLPTDDRANDLPPRWDGHRVEWKGWEVPPPSSIRFHMPPECCRACGSIEPAQHNRGVIWSEPGEVVPFRRPKSYANAVSNQAARRDGVVLGSLTAIRCPDCRYDTVLGPERSGLAREVWDLDESDYTDQGSYAK